jgi:hypothetical protein
MIWGLPFSSRRHAVHIGTASSTPCRPAVGITRNFHFESDSDSHQTEGLANPKFKPGTASKGSPHCFNWPVLPRLGTAASLYDVILTDEILPPPALIRAGLDALPSIIRSQRERASRRFIEFFTANIRNRNTRMAYARAVKQFFDWCDHRKLELEKIEPLSVAAYIEQLGAEASKPTVKQHLAAIRKLFDYLTTGGVLQSNPASSVRGPRYVVRRGKTPGSVSRRGAEADRLHRNHHLDRSARPGADRGHGLQFRAGGRRGNDASGRSFRAPKRLWLRLHEKGGKRHEVPCHPIPAFRATRILTSGLRMSPATRRRGFFAACTRGTSLWARR